ncbi:MAG: hypothetical protein KKG59_07595 [Nanoarchaeota archaeon]|nr:hypothetical protein [Nanoarchaeota archaeon]
MKEPESMDELLFFTNRVVDNGSIKAWICRPPCPKCNKLMGKSINPKTGKVIKKAEDYECPSCGFKQAKADVEKDLRVEVIYKCPYCQHEGETTTEHVRKTWQGVPSFIFECQECGQKIGITKKMKSPKKKK